LEFSPFDQNDGNLLKVLWESEVCSVLTNETNSVCNDCNLQPDFKTFVVRPQVINFWDFKHCM
jgi:hypothetical protein